MHYFTVFFSLAGPNHNEGRFNKIQEFLNLRTLMEKTWLLAFPAKLVKRSGKFSKLFSFWDYPKHAIPRQSFVLHVEVDC